MKTNSEYLSSNKKTLNAPVEIPDMLSVRVYLRPLGGELLRKRMPDWLGIAAQKLLLDALSEAGAEHMDRLHDLDSELRPFTTSTLQPINDCVDRKWRMNKEYFLRFTLTCQHKEHVYILATIASMTIHDSTSSIGCSIDGCTQFQIFI